MIRMPRQVRAKCVKCGVIADYLFNDYGSMSPCIECDAAPIELIDAILRANNI